jgi:CRP-like cAMP-binding protein
VTDARDDALERLLRLVPYFRDLDRVSLARLAGALEPIDVKAGTQITREGTEAHELYLVERGELSAAVHSPDGAVEVGQVSAPGTFGEMGLLLSRRTATVQATTDARLWRLPRERFEQLVRERPEIGLRVATSLADTLDRRQRALVGAPQLEEARPLTLDARPQPRAVRSRIIGALAAIAVPLALWWIAPPSGLSVEGWHIFLVLVGAGIAWLLEPIPDFAVALAMAGAWGVLGLASVAQAFSGFASSSGSQALTLRGPIPSGATGSSKRLMPGHDVAGCAPRPSAGQVCDHGPSWTGASALVPSRAYSEVAIELASDRGWNRTTCSRPKLLVPTRVQQCRWRLPRPSSHQVICRILPLRRGHGQCSVRPRTGGTNA